MFGVKLINVCKAERVGVFDMVKFRVAQSAVVVYIIDQIIPIKP